MSNAAPMPTLIFSGVQTPWSHYFVPKTTFSIPSYANGRSRSSSSSSRRCFTSRATTEKEESQQFEVDQEKAREALRQLDEKLLSITKTESPPAKRPSPSFPEPTLNRDRITGLRTDEMPDMSDSFFAYTAAALLLLTIFTNIIFSAYIKPSIDGEEIVTKVERVAMIDPSDRKEIPTEIE